MDKQLRVLFIGTYIPKECGIGTFTAYLLSSLYEGFNDAHSSTSIAYLLNSLGGFNNICCEVIALNDPSETYDYPEEVVFEIQRDKIEDYYRAADYINESDVDIVILQHEFGLFWGNAGDYIFALLSSINKPVISTMHTVIREPEPEYRVSAEKLIRYSEKLIVMSQTAVEMLKDVYKVPEEKIEVIFHGIPGFPFSNCEKYKQKLNLRGSPLVLTFGLLSQNKGIESVLDALPGVVSKYPDLVYLILGATHPFIKKNFGEAYRQYLKNKVSELGLEKNVVFHDKFVEKEELCNYILASDIYVSPYLSKEQIVSGALTYAIGMGKAIVSTPYWYAQEMLSDNRGLLVDFGDVDALRKSLLYLIENPEECEAMRKRAYNLGMKMTSEATGREYIKVILEEIKKRTEEFREQAKGTQFEELSNELNQRSQFLSQIRDPIGLEKHVNSIQEIISIICSKFPDSQKSEACKLLKKMYAEPLIEDKIPIIVNILSKFSYQLDMDSRLDRIEKRLDIIRFDIFKRKLENYNIISNVCDMKNELRKLNEIVSLNTFSIENLNFSETNKLNYFKNDILERLNEIETLVGNLPNNEDTQNILGKLSEIKQSDPDIFLQRSSGMATLISFFVMFAQLYQQCRLG